MTRLFLQTHTFSPHFGTLESFVQQIYGPSSLWWLSAAPGARKHQLWCVWGVPLSRFQGRFGPDAAAQSSASDPLMSPWLTNALRIHQLVLGRPRCGWRRHGCRTPHAAVSSSVSWSLLSLFHGFCSSSDSHHSRVCSLTQLISPGRTQTDVTFWCTIKVAVTLFTPSSLHCGHKLRMLECGSFCQFLHVRGSDIVKLIPWVFPCGLLQAALLLPAQAVLNRSVRNSSKLLRHSCQNTHTYRHTHTRVCSDDSGFIHN